MPRMEEVWPWLLLLLLLVLLFYTSEQFNFIVKFAYLYVVYMCMGVIISLISLPRPRHPQNGLIMAKIMRQVHSVVGVEWVLEGVERLKVDKGAVVVLNHQSSIDLLAVLELWPYLGRAAPVAKKSLMYMGPFGLGAWLVGVVFIDRQSKSSHADVNTAGRVAKETRTKLIVFPEGTRNGAKGLSMLPFKKGAFHVALDSGMPILPVVIGEYSFLDTRRWSFRPGRAVIKVLEPIDTAQYSKENINELVELTRTRMLETLKEISTQPSETSTQQDIAEEEDKKTI